VAAVNTPLLSWRNRLGLFVQSRLHSRSGRRFALILAATRLPVATVNAIMQWIIPPPKYHVHQLVPRARRRTSARLAGMFIIERGSEGEEVLDSQTSLDILMSNCDDAYGFPPYPQIRDAISAPGGEDLHPVERSIVAAALGDLPVRLIRSATMDWSNRIPRLITPYEPARVIDRPSAASGSVGAAPAMGVAGVPSD
jgi:hypothetical protein